VEEEYMSSEHEMESVMERIIINADDDDDDDDNDDNDNDDTSESTASLMIMIIYKELVQSSVTACEVSSDVK
jgi:hypothetical protein